MMFFNRLIVLMYHRVLEKPDPLRPDDVDIETFRSQLETISKLGTIVPLKDALQQIASRTLAPRSLSITFDDGYRDNLTNALPVLRQFGATGTIFISTRYLDGETMFNDLVVESIRKSRADVVDLPELALSDLRTNTESEKVTSMRRILQKLKYVENNARQEIARRFYERFGSGARERFMLTSGEVVELSKSEMEIGAHTVNHPILSKLDDSCAMHEIVESRKILEEIVGGPVSGFAYPNGKPGIDFTERDAKFVERAGFSYAASTAWGSAGRSTDLYAVPRIGPAKATGWRLMKLLARNGFGN